jgi:hypothetical protein
MSHRAPAAPSPSTFAARLFVASPRLVRLGKLCGTVLDWLKFFSLSTELLFGRYWLRLWTIAAA